MKVVFLVGRRTKRLRESGRVGVGGIGDDHVEDGTCGVAWPYARLAVTNDAGKFGRRRQHAIVALGQGVVQARNVPERPAHEVVAAGGVALGFDVAAAA